MTSIRSTAKKAACLFLAVLLTAAMLVTAPAASAAAAFVTSDTGVNLIKSFEGFNAYKHWDYSQWSIGYGTACGANDYPNGITEAEAVVLLKRALSTSEQYVNTFLNKYGLTVNQNQFDAMVSFTYNLGNVWVTNDSFTLRNYLLDGIEKYSQSDIHYAFGLWCKAGGQVLEGLVRRRAAEASLFCTPVNYILRFDANGGSNAPSAIAGSAVQIPAQAPTRSLHEFLGWSDSPNGTAQYQPGSTLTLTGNRTLYAVWKAYSVLTFDANGGSGAPSPIHFREGQSLQLPAAQPTRDGYIFLGWDVDPTADAPSFPAGGSFSAGASLTLYAVWSKTVSVTYDPNGGSGARLTVGKAANAPLKINVSRPTRAGYAFLGWSTNPQAAAAEYAHGGVFTGSSDTTLYAVWQRYITIALDAQGGSFNLPEGLCLGDLNGDGSITEADYALLQAAIGTAADETTKIVGDLNLDGRLDTLDLMILEDYLSGTLATLPAKCTAEGSSLGTLPTPTKEGAFFTGWYGSADESMSTNSGVISIPSGSAASASIRRLFATWSDTPLRGDVTFDGILSVSDVVALRTFILNGNTADAALLPAYDVDGDGSITVTDVIALRALISR